MANSLPQPFCPTPISLGENMFTCIKCNNKYDHITGDIDERMCYDCLNMEEKSENR